MRSLLRWLRRLGLAVLALAAIVLGAALITAHTGWGRERLRRRVEAALREAFPGGARVAALDGSVLGTLRLRGVELDALDHRPLITAGSIDVALALTPLAFHTARFDRAVADDVHVFVRDAAVAAPAAAAPGEPSPWRIELPEVAIHRAVVDIARASLALGDLDVAGALTVAGGRVDLSGIVRGRGSRGGRPGVPLAAAGTLRFDGGLRISHAVAAIGDATLVARDLAVDPDHPAGWLAVAAPPATVAALVPELDAAAPVIASAGQLAVAVDLVPDRDATRGSVVAAAGDARLWLALRGDPARRTAHGLILAHGLDLAVATRGRVAGRGAIAGAVAIGPDRGRGVAWVHGELASDGLPLRRAGALVAGTLDDIRVLAAGSGDDDLALAGFAGARRDAGAWVVEHGRVIASARGVALPGPRVTGALALDAQLDRRLVLGAGRAVTAQISGVVTGRGVRVTPAPPGRGVTVGALRSPFALSVATGDRGPEIAVAVHDASATAVVRDDVRVEAARASFTAAVTPDLRLETAALAGRAIRRAGTLLGDVEVALARRGDDYRVAATARPPRPGFAIATEARLRPVAAGYRAALGATRVDIPGGGAWTGLGGTLIVPEAERAAIQLAGLSLRRGEASLAVAADYLRAGGAFSAHVEAAGVDLAGLGLAGPRGVGRGSLELAYRGGRWQADASVGVAGLAMTSGATPVDAAVHLALGRRVALDATLGGAMLGELGLSFEAAAPDDPLDLAAWRRLDRDSIRSAVVTARHLALGELADLAGVRGAATAAGLTGFVDGAVELAPGALRGELAVRGVALPLGSLDGRVRIAPADGELDARATATLVGVASAEATLRLALPRYPLDPATWQRHGRDLVRDGSLRLDEVAFDPALLARLGVTQNGEPPPYRGRARAWLGRGDAPGSLRLTVDLLDVTGGPLAGALSPHLELVADAAGTRLHGELRGSGGVALGAFDGSVQMTLEHWLDEPLAVLGAPAAARWQLPRTDVVPLLALLGRRELIAGTVEASAELRGTVASPLVPSLTVAVRDARMAPRLGGRAVPELRALDLAASWDGANTELTLTGREATGGELRVTASGRPRSPGELSGSARLTRLDVTPIAAFLPGALASATGVVDGEIDLARGNRVTGRLRVTGGALPLAAAIGTLREATADLASDGRSVTATVDGRLGRGAIHVTARAPADDLAAVTADVQLRDVSPIMALRPIITADVKAELHRAGDQLRGEIRVERGSVTLPERSGAALLAVDVPADLVIAGAGTAPAGPRTPHAPAHPWLVVDVRLGALRVDARNLAEGIGLLGTLRGDHLEVALGDTVGVRGTIDIESADVDIFGRRYVVAPSALVFDGTTDPRLDIHMSHSFPDLTLQVDVLGRASRRELQFSSDVSVYSTDTLFAFFLGGEPSSDVNNPTRDQARAAVLGATARLVSGKLGQQISKVLPVRIDVSCEPSPDPATTSAGSCTAGRWLLDQVFLAYRQRLQPRPDENPGEAQLQIRLGNRLLLDATVGDAGHHGADLLWRQRW